MSILCKNQRSLWDFYNNYGGGSFFTMALPNIWRTCLAHVAEILAALSRRYLYNLTNYIFEICRFQGLKWHIYRLIFFSFNFSTFIIWGVLVHIFTKFHEDWAKIVDFLLIANYLASPLFYYSHFSSNIKVSPCLNSPYQKLIFVVVFSTNLRTFNSKSS